MDEARYLKRKVKAGRIDVHPSECAIVVHYEVEALILGDEGDAMHGERKQCQKIIHLGKALSNSSNVHQLAESIVEKCQLIHPTKLPELEQLLVFLQKRKKQHGSALEEASKKRLGQATGGQVAQFAEVDTYVDMLYEEMPDKIKGTGLILQLVRSPDNMEELARNERLLSALSRELREYGTKSIELATNVVQIFFFFSSYSNFHDLIAKHKLGFSCLQIVEHETKRYETLKKTLSHKRRQCKDGKITKEEYQAAKKQFEDDEFSQDTLLYVCLHLLLNIAEDTRVEFKIRNKQIVVLLAECLKRQNVELLLLVVTFLKKLSVFLENKNEMVSLNILEHLERCIVSPCEPLQFVALRLLLNLSFDGAIRAKIVDMKLLPGLVSLMGKQSTLNIGAVATCLVYHISMDEKMRSHFESGENIVTPMRLILQSRETRPAPELLALTINLALNEATATAMCANGGLKMLVKAALASGDPLMFKLLHNLARHRSVQPLFRDFIEELMALLVRTQDDDVAVEVLGVLAGLRLPDFDFERLVDRFNLLDFLVQRLLPGAALDDMMLEIVILLGSLANSDKVAARMARAGIIASLVELLKAKQEDDEFVLQIMIDFYRLVLQPSTRQVLVTQTEAVSYLLDLLFDKQPAIRAVCGRALDVIVEYDQEWAQKIRMRRFQVHNAEWLRVVLHEGPHDAEMENHFGDEFEAHDPEGTTQAYYDDYDQGRFAEGQGDLHDADFLDSGEDDYA